MSHITFAEWPSPLADAGGTVLPLTYIRSSNTEREREMFTDVAPRLQSTVNVNLAIYLANS